MKQFVNVIQEHFHLGITLQYRIYDDKKNYLSTIHLIDEKFSPHYWLKIDSNSELYSGVFNYLTILT